MARSTVLAMVAAATIVLTGTANAGIANTKHNMSSSGHWNYTGVNEDPEALGPLGSSSGTGEICVFCHTPHGANTFGPGPLWNRMFNLPKSAYVMYDSWTLDGKVANNGGPPVGSMLCLSCHDGTQAMDTLVNGPTGSRWTGDNSVGSDQGWSWRESKWMSSGVIGNTPEIPYIGTDLSDDHPTMIQYGGGGLLANSGVPTGSLKDPQFHNPLFSTSHDARGTWFFDTDGFAGLTAGDVKLYTNTYAVFKTLSGHVEPSVECYSCHDPHRDDSTPFLRMSNSASELCLTCHNM